ncbi:metallophosphoesterase family protein [Georgenia alba]|uniref:Metallophosphoesterase n=1 Tax=Georgenia alba TaxID=2233858 RepID=A0ABW2QBT7_9MICO
MEDVPGPPRRWEWWHRQTPLTRKTIRTTLTLLVTGVVAVAIGVPTASSRSSLGPHAAEYHVTLDSQVAIQMGPLGAIILDSPLPGPLGAEVVVQEIPTDVEGASAPDSPVPGLLADLAAYGQLFARPEVAVADAVRSLVGDALGRTAVAWSLLLVLIAAGRLAAGGHLRDEVRHALARPGVAVLAAGGLIAATAAVVVPAVVRDEPAGYSPRVLDGTPMEGAVITGRLADVVAVYGTAVRDAVEENEAFYAEAADNLARALATDPAPAPPPVPDEAGAEGALSDPVTFLLAADLHCNVGMAAVVRSALEHTGAVALLDAGDTVTNGTSPESFCVETFADAVPDGLPVLVATGNHDSVVTADQERDVGWTVLAGDVVEVEGVRFLGDTDPTLTSLGSGTVQERDETVEEMGDRLADVACGAADGGDGVDVLLVHNPRAGEAALDRGCVPLQLSGHWHRTDGPAVLGSGVRYVSTSSGGGAGGGVTIGPLTSDAELTVLRIDRDTGRPLDHRRIVVDTDAQVRLAPWESFPVP